MARRRTAVVVDRDEHGEVIDWYRRALAEPPVFPWEGCRWAPTVIGPTWLVGDDGRWLLPKRTLGWHELGWAGTHLQHQAGQPWRYTLEQARLILWWYALDEDGRWLYRDGVIQRLKGWGKDPVGATLCANEMSGPCRVLDFDGDEVVATDQPDAWVQTAATALEQTKNTMRLFPGLYTPETIAEYGLQLGKEIVHGHGDTRMIQAVTSSPTTLEGARATAVLKNETQHWKASNSGHDMAAVIERNATKSEHGGARTLAITNAYEPSEESSAQHDREAWEAAAAGETLTTGILYDSVEAPPDAPLTAEAAPEVIRAIRGDSIWLDPERIVQSILDTRNPPSRSRRFWYNQITATEDAWIVPQQFDLLSRPQLGVGHDLLLAGSGDDIALFFDGSKSDDATGIVGCRIRDGHVLTLGMWQRPPTLDRDTRWTVPRADVDERVTRIFEQFNVVAFWGDPSHVLDDETQERYWDDLIDEWHVRYRSQLGLWAVPGKAGHSVMWDMTSPARSQQFTSAAERCAQDIKDGTLTWDGDGRLKSHTHNARRYPNRWGVSLWKGHRESKRKIDLAVCMVGARMLRRLVQTNGPAKKQRSGKAW